MASWESCLLTLVPALVDNLQAAKVARVSGTRPWTVSPHPPVCVNCSVPASYGKADAEPQASLPTSLASMSCNSSRYTAPGEPTIPSALYTSVLSYNASLSSLKVSSSEHGSSWAHREFVSVQTPQLYSPSSIFLMFLIHSTYYESILCILYMDFYWVLGYLFYTPPLWVIMIVKKTYFFKLQRCCQKVAFICLTPSDTASLVYRRSVINRKPDPFAQDQKIQMSIPHTKCSIGHLRLWVKLTSCSTSPSDHSWFLTLPFSTATEFRVILSWACYTFYTLVSQILLSEKLSLCLVCSPEIWLLYTYLSTIILFSSPNSGRKKLPRYWLW